MSATLIRPFDYQKAVNEILNEHNIKQSALAEYLGVSQGRISQILNGIDSHSAKYETRHRLFELCEKYGVEVEFTD